MADSGIFRVGGGLQPWQREAILRAASFLRERFGGNPPADDGARLVHDRLLEVVDPTRRTVRMQREMTESARHAALTVKTERRGNERRRVERRTQNLGPPSGTPERRRGERRSGTDRRAKR
jgi:hypothetical protein